MSAGMILPAGSPLVQYPTHQWLKSSQTRKVIAVMDCFTGKTLRAFGRRYPIRGIVESGAIAGSKDGIVHVEKTFWVVVGYSSWQTARSMALKCRSGNAPFALESGVWHEVISE